jgi:hypothetical protein
MGEQTLFNPGDKAPNQGTYIETGDRDRIMGIENPEQIELDKGEHFPETTNQDRKWTRK